MIKILELIRIMGNYTLLAHFFTIVKMKKADSIQEKINIYRKKFFNLRDLREFEHKFISNLFKRH